MKIKVAEFIPEEIENDVLYFSPEFSTAIHLCMCGCENKVVTPFARSEWKLTFEDSFSLHPSIGNWNFKCQSHYWIRDGKVVWCKSDQVSDSMIDKIAISSAVSEVKSNRFINWLRSMKEKISRCFWHN